MTELLFSKARDLHQKGESRQAALIYKEALENTQDPKLRIEALGFLGGWRHAEQDYDEAVEYFAQCAALCGDHPRLEFEWANAIELSGRVGDALPHYLKALRLHPKNARYLLYAGAALDALGRHEEALQVWSIGADVDIALRKVKDDPNADTETRDKSHAADSALRAAFSDLHRQTVGDASELRRVRDAIWVQTHDGEFQYKNRMQQPHVFYMPDLPAIPVFHDLEWMPTLERHWRDIREEYLTAAHALSGAPYIEKNAMLGAEFNLLKGSMDWKSIHLFQNAAPNEDVIRHFPKTVEALQSVPLVRVDGQPMEVFFSVLAPKTRIPPHFGLANSRMTTHLPLIIPDNCSIRVADETHQWQEGKVFSFDDSFRHAAANDGEETRVVLIFESWAPDLSAAEQDAISKSFSVRTDWLKQRRIPNA